MHLEVIEPELLAFAIHGLSTEQAPDVVTVLLTEPGDCRIEMHFWHRGTHTAQWECAHQAASPSAWRTPTSSRLLIKDSSCNELG